MPMSSSARTLLAAGAIAVLGAGSAAAQLLPSLPLPPVQLPVGSVPVAGPVVDRLLRQPEAQQVIRPTLDTVSGLPQQIAESGGRTLLRLRQLRLQQLIRENPSQLEAADNGQPVRRGMLVAINPGPAELRAAARAGFRLIATEPVSELGMTTAFLRVPAGMGASEALRRLRRAAPGIEADFDHIFEPAGGSLLPVSTALAASGQSGAGGGPRIGLIDGGVASHPALANASVEQHGFSGRPQATGHGTAVASLIVGDSGPFRGGAPGASLFVADVYGGNRAAGSASAMVRALNWLAVKRPQVINVSLVGPSNRLVERAVQSVRARGIQLVAAVGNDGPAAPPQFPASYSGVVAVTAVDARGRALPEAGKAAHLDFAAPGADMAAALPGQGYARVRGTSFAAPLAASRLALAGSVQRLAGEARPGRGRVGRGIVCGPCRVEPRAVRAK